MENFPDTLLLKIFSYLRNGELARVSRVNSVWRRVSLDWRLWQRVNLKKYGKKIGDLLLKKLIQNVFPSKLLSLNLSGFNISTGTLHTLSNECPQLNSLNLESVIFHESYPNSPDVKYFPRTLKKLNLANSTGPQSVYRNMSKSLYVDHLECFSAGDEFLESLVQASNSQHFMDFFLRQRWSLKTLEFSYCEKLTDYALTFVTFCCRNLQSLCVRRCRKLEGNFLRSVFAVAPSSLRSLVLDGTIIQDQVLASVQWERCLITELDLSWCRYVTEAGLLTTLPMLKFLRYLRICCCGYGHALTDKVLRRMAQKSWNFLEVVDFSYSCEITNSATREFLLRCSKLEYLRLNHCRKITQNVLENAPHLSNVYINASFPVARACVIVNALPQHLIGGREWPQSPSFRQLSMSKEVRSN